jgi:hypothetical protein
VPSVPAWLVGSTSGLSADGWTAILGLAMTALWLGSLGVLRSPRRGWRAVPLTLLGWSWIGFGLAFVARFWVLSIDAVTYGDMSERLLVVPAAVVNEALVLSTLYWVAVVLAYRVVPAPRLNALTSVGRIVHRDAVAAYDALSAVALAAIVLNPEVERNWPVLVRPLALLGSLWVCSAAAAWFLSLSGGGRRFAVRRWVYLAPGIVSFAYEPFRERLLLMLLIPFLAALFAGRRVRLGIVVAVFAVFAVTSTVAVSWYRQVAWERQSVSVSTESLDPGLWLKDPYHAPWTAVLRRFHSFDSLVFYTHLVPDVVPFEVERNPLLDLLLEGFVPRALYPDKPESRRAALFSVTVWSYGDEGRDEANIAPSMAGDLYGVGGWLWVVLGGGGWGALLGVLDGWRKRLAPGGQAVVITMLALLAAGGIERDFPRATATLIQTTIVLIGLAIVMTRAIGLGPLRLARARPAGPADRGQEPAALP